MILAGTVAPPALADPTPNPGTVTLVGSLQSELGCSGDWMPGCTVTNLSFDAGNGDGRGSFDIVTSSRNEAIVKAH
ncbi:pullulanase X25 domain-containing protein [Marinobacterium sedimentorum]|uniref:pullulanase X25 domain-containing protein n=1 Tax=Marinobacterium sedimentorum TaxID=2927804 RepID=UPI0020C745D7|nr:hypothetical protein [Marinobacterium sedimentorum]MCP8690205.1 hypothetical protein [Marinobacterium sedimentorum]